ncbi:MAG: hypothetical protein WKG07_11155 [Hymenobacter sp.]
MRLEGLVATPRTSHPPPTPADLAAHEQTTTDKDGKKHVYRGVALADVLATWPAPQPARPFTARCWPKPCSPPPPTATRPCSRCPKSMPISPQTSLRPGSATASPYPPRRALPAHCAPEISPPAGCAKATGLGW